MEGGLDFYFTLNYFKHSQKYSDFSEKILNFLWRTGGAGGFAPYSPSNDLLACVLGADPRFLGKIKLSINLTFLTNPPKNYYYLRVANQTLLSFQIIFLIFPQSSQKIKNSRRGLHCSPNFSIIFQICIKFRVYFRKNYYKCQGFTQQ